MPPFGRTSASNEAVSSAAATVGLFILILNARLLQKNYFIAFPLTHLFCLYTKQGIAQYQSQNLKYKDGLFQFFF